MNSELNELIHRWHAGTLSSDGLRRLNELLNTPEARAALHDEWFLDATLPEALLAAPAWNVELTPSRTRTRWRLSLVHRWALGAAAVLTLACVVWEHSGFPLEQPEAFAAQVAAASLEP